MKKQIIIVTALVFALVGLSGSAFAWSHGQGHGKKGCRAGANSPMANLTEAQQTQLKALHQKFIDETAETRAAMRAKKDEMRILMQTSAPDEQRLVDLANQAGDLQKAMMVERIKFALETKKIAPEVNFQEVCRGFGKRGGMGYHRNGMPMNNPDTDSPDSIDQ
jgi:zinc resistance-associated protein